MGPGLHLLGNEHCDLDFNILLIVLFISLDFHARQWIYKVFQDFQRSNMMTKENVKKKKKSEYVFYCNDFRNVK